MIQIFGISLAKNLSYATRSHNYCATLTQLHWHFYETILPLLCNQFNKYCTTHLQVLVT
jgi:hypothetical protein